MKEVEMRVVSVKKVSVVSEWSEIKVGNFYKTYHEEYIKILYKDTEVCFYKAINLEDKYDEYTEYAYSTKLSFDPEDTILIPIKKEDMVAELLWI